MPVIDATHDLDARTITITAEFAAPVERIWQIYVDPRQLERVYGPPTHPATFVEHDLSPGRRTHYFMTSPEGERFYGWWRITAVDEPRSFAFEDGFAADDSFAPAEDLPVSKNVYAFEAIDGGTRATYTSTYDSADALQKILEMEVVEGTSSAIDQIDTLVGAAITTTPGSARSDRPGRPAIVDLDTWQAARDELLVREKAHTREGDAIAAARRRLPMTEIDATLEVTGADGPVPFIDLFQGHDVLVVHKHMFHDGIAFDGQCMGCTTNTWHIQRAAVYLAARGVSFAVLTEGPWDEVARFVEFMGYTEPWYSTRGVDGQVGEEMGSITCYLRDGDRVFLTYWTTARGNEAAAGVFGLLDMTPYGRGEAWEEVPDGWPEGQGSCWYWRTDADGVATFDSTSRPVPQWTRPGATPVVDGAGNHQ